MEAPNAFAVCFFVQKTDAPGKRLYDFPEGPSRVFKSTYLCSRTVDGVITDVPTSYWS